MAGVLSRPVDDPVLAPKKPPGILSRIAAMPNPGYLVSQGVDRITTPGYPVDDALRGYMGRAPAFQPTLGQAASAWRDEGLGQSSEFLTALQRGDMDAVMNSSLFPMGAMTAYHGSPHKFDAFDLSKIGTGEGAQAYGHGLYFAENKGVAKGYSTAGLLGTKGVRVGGRVVTSNGTTGNSATAEDYAVDALTRFKGDKKAAIEWLDDFGSGAEARKWIQANIKGKTAELADVGNLYHVDIPDDEIAKMLDWDKPLSEQPESVRKALFASGYKPDAADVTGSQIYMDFGFDGGERAASERLRSLGIPGIKYLDDGSRRAGEGTRNLVLFDDKLAKVLKRE